MPIINKPLVMTSGDSVELLETSAMTNGERVRSRLIFKGGTGLRVVSHIHPLQDETYEVISGNLTYLLDGVKHVAPAGTTVRLPRGVPHQHYSEGPEDAVTIQTMTPGLDFDYLLENLFGLGSEGRGITAIGNTLHALIWLKRLKCGFVRSDFPAWFQRGVAAIATPILELLGYRAVYQRFSGEEW
jgi:mannose-6-phosphate isomerase-like protein (cupin superfamily)